MVRQLYQEEAARNGLDHVQILTPYRVKTVNGANEAEPESGGPDQSAKSWEKGVVRRRADLPGRG